MTRTQADVLSPPGTRPCAMEFIALNSLLSGSYSRLGLTGQRLRGGLTTAVNRVRLLQGTEDRHLLSTCGGGTVLVVPPFILHPTSNSTGEKEKAKIWAVLQMSEIACLALPGLLKRPDFLPHFASASESAKPVICSRFDEFLLASRLTGLLREKLRHRVFLHGALVNMYGLGVLVTGDSGCGKTSGALGLAARGHKWIADDAIEIEKRPNNLLYGCSHVRSKGLLEIKGRGIILAGEMLPAVAMDDETPLDLIVEIKKRTARAVPVHSGGRFYRTIMAVKLPVMRFPPLSRGNWWLEELERAVQLMRQME